MKDATIKQESQINWLSLGYEATPFSNACNKSQLFFKSQSLINTLNRLCTLDSGGICITALTGEQGCGKTTCLRALSKMRTHYHSIMIEATKGLSPQNLTKAIFQASILTTQTSRQPTTEECISLLKKLTLSKKQIRLLVDNAQKLPKETISLIKKLACIQPNGSQLQFILCTETPKAISTLQGDAQVKTQSIQLKNLSRKETEKFINLKLQSGTSAPPAHKASSEHIDKLYEKTNGNIFKINEEATRALPSMLKKQAIPGATKAQLKHQRTPQPVYISLATLLFTSATLLAMHGVSTAPIKQTTQRPEKTQKVPFPTPQRVSKLIHALTQSS